MSGSHAEPASPATTARPELDLLPAEEVVELLLRAEERVVPAVRAATPEIVSAAQLLAECVRAGGRIVFVGAGTSGRLALVEAAELPGTFGLPRDRVAALLAGAGVHGLTGTDGDEDDEDAGRREMRETRVGAGDVVIAVAASGRTPYTVAAAREAVARGAHVVAVVAATGSPLAELARITIVLGVGPEVLRDSTRLTAGTAQKVALDALTTTSMVLAGRVHGDVMVDVVAANEKLRTRAVGIVAEIAGCSTEEARAALVVCDWNARAATVHLVRGTSPTRSLALAAAHRSLREALDNAGR